MDIVYVYDGSTVNDTVLGAFSGNTLPAPLTSSSPSMLVRFVTDQSISSTGFSAQYVGNYANATVPSPSPTIPPNDTITPSPSPSPSSESCPKDCGEHGKCNNGKCICDAGFSSENCIRPNCDARTQLTKSFGQIDSGPSMEIKQSL